MSHYFTPRLRDVVFVIIFIGALALGPRMLNTDSDLGKHLTLGQFILDTRQIPTRDILSFTRASQSRPPYEWLAQVLFALAYRFLNLDGVVILAALILGLTFALVYNDASPRSKTPILALMFTLWAAAASSIHWLTRPHVFSFLFLAIWIYGLEQIRTGKKFREWLFPLLMLIWANTHGGFIFGFLAWGAYLAGWLVDFWKKSSTRQIFWDLLTVGVTSVIASIMTPDLWHNWEGVLNNRSAYVLSRTAETMPPDFTLPAIWPFIGLLALILILSLLRWKQASASHLFLLAGLAGMSLVMARNIPLFAIAAAPIATEWVSTTISSLAYWIKIEETFTKIEETLHGFLWPATVMAAAVGFFAYHAATTRTPVYQFNPQIFPVQAVSWIESNSIPGNMFNDFNWGGYLLYRLWPGQRVFVDSQSDFYGEAFMRQYSDIMNGAPNWDVYLNQYDVSWIIVPPDAGLAVVAGASPKWKTVYHDPVAIIFERK